MHVPATCSNPARARRSSVAAGRRGPPDRRRGVAAAFVRQVEDFAGAALDGRRRGELRRQPRQRGHLRAARIGPERSPRHDRSAAWSTGHLCLAAPERPRLSRAVMLPGGPPHTVAFFVNNTMDRVENYDTMELALFRAEDIKRSLVEEAGRKNVIDPDCLGIEPFPSRSARSPSVAAPGRRPVDDDDGYGGCGGTARAMRRAVGGRMEMVRVTVNVPEAAAAVPEIKQRMLDAGCTAPLIGDFHYNGHLLLDAQPGLCAHSYKYRINPGNVGTGKRRDEQFATICSVARGERQTRAHRRQRRLAQSGARHDQDAGEHRPEPGRNSEDIINECMVLSAIQSTELALESGLRQDQIIISCKTSRPLHLIRRVSRAGEGDRAAARIWATVGRHGRQRSGVVGLGHGRAAARRHRRHDPRVADAAPGGDRRDEVYAACELLAGPRPAVVRAERHGLSGLRAHDELDVPGARRSRAGLHPREDAGVEDQGTTVSRRSPSPSWAASSTAPASRRPPTSASRCPALAKRRTVRCTSTASMRRRCAARMTKLARGVSQAAGRLRRGPLPP